MRCQISECKRKAYEDIYIEVYPDFEVDADATLCEKHFNDLV